MNILTQYQPPFRVRTEPQSGQDLLRQGLNSLTRWWRETRSSQDLKQDIAYLENASDHVLQDIGLTRDQVREAVVSGRRV
jgi:uncharacterized protein YjiS (DUF1127 family)